MIFSIQLWVSHHHFWTPSHHPMEAVATRTSAPPEPMCPSSFRNGWPWCLGCGIRLTGGDKNVMSLMNLFLWLKTGDINVPAPGLPRVCFGIFLRVFMMTFMLISCICKTFEAIIIMFGQKMWLILLRFIFSSFFTCICTLLWTPGVERGCFRMPCFLMDLRFATGREQKIRTFRFFFWRSYVWKCKRRDG